MNWFRVVRINCWQPSHRRVVAQRIVPLIAGEIKRSLGIDLTSKMVSYSHDSPSSSASVADYGIIALHRLLCCGSASFEKKMLLATFNDEEFSDVNVAPKSGYAENDQPSDASSGSSMMSELSVKQRRDAALIMLLALTVPVVHLRHVGVSSMM